MAKNVARRAHALMLLGKRIERIKQKDARIVEATQLSAVIDDLTQEEVDTLTPLERRVARDARLSKREAPMYLELAAKRFEVERKVEALRGSPTALNAQVVAFVIGSPEATARYPVIDVEAKDVTQRELPPLPEKVTKEAT